MNIEYCTTYSFIRVTLVEVLIELCHQLEMTEKIEFVTNASYNELMEKLKIAKVGLHTMKNEHFGISIVEMMAAGLLTIAHDSAGPKMDIITEQPNEKRTGYLANTQEEYAECMRQALTLSEKEAERVRQRARASVQRFSEPEFDQAFLQALTPALSARGLLLNESFTK